MHNYACVVPSYDASQDWELTGANEKGKLYYTSI